LAEVKWIKIVTDIFNNKKIKQIDAMPDADTILVIWFKLMCLAGNINENGLIILTKDIAYTDEMLATEFRKPINTIRLALNIFDRFGMVEIVDDIYRISNWEKYQNISRLNDIREYNRLAKRREREKKKLLLGVNDKSMTSQRCHDTDIDIDIDKDIDKEKDKDKTALDRAVDDFKSFRKKIKSPMTDKAVSLLLINLEKLAPGDDETKIAILEQSILNGWKSVYALKADNVQTSRIPRAFQDLMG
jgi:predicted phage replisome organizer